MVLLTTWSSWLPQACVWVIGCSAVVDLILPNPGVTPTRFCSKSAEMEENEMDLRFWQEFFPTTV